MEFLDLPLIVRRDILGVLDFTKKRFGETKASDYAELIFEALDDLTRDPQSGHRRVDIHPDAWVYPIRKPARNARHLFLYEVINGAPIIYGFVYDGRNLPSQWRGRSSQ